MIASLVLLRYFSDTSPVLLRVFLQYILLRLLEPERKFLPDRKAALLSVPEIRRADQDIVVIRHVHIVEPGDCPDILAVQIKPGPCDQERSLRHFEETEIGNTVDRTAGYSVLFIRAGQLVDVARSDGPGLKGHDLHSPVLRTGLEHGNDFSLKVPGLIVRILIDLYARNRLMRHTDTIPLP